MSQERAKIVFLINSLGGGGAEKIMKTLLENIDRDKFDVSLSFTCENRIDYDIDQSIPLHMPNLDSVRVNAISYFIIKMLSLIRCVIPLSEYKQLRKRYSDIFNRLVNLYKGFVVTRDYVETVKPQLIVSFLFYSSLIAIVLKWISKNRFKVVCSDHCTLTNELKNYFPLTYVYLPRLLYKGLDAYVAVSEGVQRDLVESYHLSREKIRIINNGSNIQEIKALSLRQVPSEVKLLLPNDGVFSIVNVGRLAPPKNQAVLLKAFQIVRKHCACRLYVVGQGELLTELTNLASVLGITQDVYFLGWQENPFSIMAKCDLFVLSSSWEAFPNVLVEAMAVGLPIVSTDCPTGPREALADGAYGDLIPVNDIEALANAIIRMHDDTARRMKFARLGADRAETFAFSHMISSYEHLINELLAKY